ncbi:MAG: FtsX-like permease family protein [Luteitalea sp.]|nr:FtsX-like permease family protein [Luteitalea sp.]
MLRLRRLIGGFKALFHKHRVEQELDEELRAYLETSVEEKIRAGMARDDAIRAARVEIGSLEAVKDHTRDVGWEVGLESTWRDVRYAVRTLRKSPAFSAVAVLTLALGIGANTAIFSVVNAVMLRPLRVERPEDLIALAAVHADNVDPLFSYSAYRQFAVEGAHVAEAIAASSVRRGAITIDGPPEPVDHKWVSANYFPTLGVRAAVGRTLLPSDDRVPPGEPVAVLSDAFWTRRFGRDPSVIGRSFRFQATAFTIVGVAPRGFFGETVGEALDIWMPLSAGRGAPSYVWSGHSTTWLRILARRRPAVTLAQARAGLEAVYGRIRDDVAGGTDSSEFRESVLESRLAVSEASGGSSRLRDNLSAPLLILMGIVGLVLVIACANVANLMLARAATRRRETAVCLAIGAARLRVVRHGLAEALLLAALGGVAGLLLAFWGSSVLVALVSGALPISLDVSPDVRVLAFTMLVSSATAVVFGLLPALRAARIDPLAVLKVSGGSGRGMVRIPLRRTLVVTQIAVSLVLLVVAGLFVRSLLKLKDIDMGFDPDRVLVFQVTPPVDEQPISDEPRRNLYRELLARAETVPGVHGASASSSGVFTRGTWGNAITVEGFVPRSGVTPRTLANSITPRYFEVMRIAVLLGRGFTNDDHETARKVAVINQTFARQFFGEADPIGKRVGLCSSDPCGSPPMMEIVGVTEDAKYVDLREEKQPMLYVPFTQYDQHLRELEVRTAGAPAAVAATLHRELAGVDSRLAIVAMLELRDQVDASIVAERLIAKLSATFGLLALALAAIGLYGVIAYVTAERTGEIGIRMALGADRRAVGWLVLRDTITLVVIGVVIGIPAALAGARLLASQLYEVGPNDSLAVSLGLVTLVVAAILAGYLPARRAARVDPVVALRAE